MASMILAPRNHRLERLALYRRIGLFLGIVLFLDRGTEGIRGFHELAVPGDRWATSSSIGIVEDISTLGIFLHGFLLAGWQLTTLVGGHELLADTLRDPDIAFSSSRGGHGPALGLTDAWHGYLLLGLTGVRCGARG